MSDQMCFALNIEERGRHECAAQILLCMLYPELDYPDQILNSRYDALCGYLLRFTANQSDYWAEDLQTMRPIHAFVSEKDIAQVGRDIKTRQRKALWTGLVAHELLTGIRWIGEPGDPARVSVDPIAYDIASALKMTATNFTSRAWRPWARAAHLCAAFAHFHIYDSRPGKPFNLINYLIYRDEGPLAFAAVAAAWEEEVADHPKIPASAADLHRVRIHKNRS